MTLSYGMAQTDIASNADRTKMVGVVKGILGNNSYVKSDLSASNIAKGATFTFTTYDNLANDVSTNGVRWLPSLHSTGYTVPPSDGIVSDPVGTGGMQGWYEFLTACCNRYAPSGSFAHAGWQPITTWELWNEPNGIGDTGTSAPGYGGAFTLDQNGIKRLSVATLYHIIKDGANAIKAHGVAHSWTPKIIGYGSNSIDLVYLQAAINYFVTQTDSLFNYLNAFSIHMFETEDPSSPGGSSPSVSSRMRSIANLRSVLDNNAGTACRIWVTEGGFAGADKWNEYQTTFNSITIPAASAANKVLWATTGHGGGGQPPNIATLTPVSGYVGDTITLGGSNFTGTTGVTFNGISATFTIVNDSTITAQVPSANASGDVVATNANGPSGSGDIFTINPPTISAISPTTGLPNSTAVVSGRGFTGFTSVTVGGIAVSPASPSDSSLTIVIPGSLAAGSVTVSITTPGGTDTIPFTVQSNTISVVDSFTGRTTTNGFGTTSDGNFNWTVLQGNIVEYSVGGGTGKIQMPTLPATGPIISLDFEAISGTSVPDVSGHGNNGTGQKGPVGNETAWSPTTTSGFNTPTAIVFDGTKQDRVEIPNVAHALDVNTFSILAWISLNESVDTDPLHQRYEIMEKSGSFWLNVREDTSPQYVLRVGGFFGASTLDTFVGLTPIASNTPTHVAGTYDGTQLATFVNGNTDQTQATTGTTATGATITGIDENLVVGAKHRMGHANGGSGTNEVIEALFNGVMDSFKVYNIALTKPQIWTVMNELTTGSAPIVTLGGFNLGDSDVMVKYSFDTPSAGSTQSIAPAMQLTDAQNYQRCVVTQTVSGNTNIKIQRQVVGVNTDIVTQTSITAQTPGTNYWIRFKAVGSTYSAWVWPDGAQQPVSPTVSGVDSGFGTGSTSGTVGLRLQTLNTNTNGPIYSVQGFQAAASLDGPPSGGIPSLSDDTPVVTEVLTCNPGNWGSPLPQFGFQWQVSATGTGSWSNATGVGNATANYTVAGGDQTKFLRCVVTATNNFGSGTANSEVSSAVGPAPSVPVNTVPPLLSPSSSLVIGSALAVTNGSWTGSPTSFHYHWFRIDPSTGIPTQIAAPDSPNYTVASADNGFEMQAQVQAVNGNGSSAFVGSNITTTVGGGGGSTVTRKNTSSLDAAAASVTGVTPPANTSDLDILIAQVVARGSISAITASAAAGSWTQIGTTSDNHGDQIVTAGFWKVASNEATNTYSFSSTGASAIKADITGFSGVDNTTPVSSITTSASNTGTGDMVMNIHSVANVLSKGMALGLIGATCGPRPWGDTGCVFGAVDNAGVGKYDTQTGIANFENVVYAGTSPRMVLAMGHSMPPFNMTSSGFPAAPSGPNGDLANNRMAFVSWPRQSSWPDTSTLAGGSTGDVYSTLNDIANGNYDDYIALTGLALNKWKHPTIFRLMWEMTGGDPPWAVGHQNGTHTLNQWVSAYKAAWQRIFIIIRGTQAQVTALSPGYGANLNHKGQYAGTTPTPVTNINGGLAIKATNVYFHYNAENFDTVNAVQYEEPWPGDPYVHFAGLEGYKPQSGTDDWSVIMNNADSVGSNLPFYTVMGPGGSLNHTYSFMGNGEAGVRNGAGGSDVTWINSMLSATTGLPGHPAWKFYIYWDGSGIGNSQIDSASMPATTVTAFQNFAQNAYMRPALKTTWDANTVGPWSIAYQSRRAIAQNKAFFGPTMIGSMMVQQANAGAGTITAPGTSPASYGFGNWASISFALNPA